MNNYLFTGAQYDLDLGLYYLRARYQNTDTGRFWTEDSFGGVGTDPLSLHKYTYCENDPVNNFDPSGHFSLAEISMTQAIGMLSFGINVLSAIYNFRHCHYVKGSIDLLFAALGAVGVILPPGGTSFALAGVGSFQVAQNLAQLLVTLSSVNAAMNIPDLIRLMTQSLGGPSGGSTGGPSPSDPYYNVDRVLETAGTRRQIIDILRGKMAGFISKIRQIDPKAQLGIRGSTVSGWNARKGVPWDPKAFDLDVYVKSEILVKQGDYFPLPELGDELRAEFPDLFGGLNKNGLSVKTFHQVDLGKDAENF